MSSINLEFQETEKPLMEVSNLHFSYYKKKPILYSLNFYVNRGEIIGISGENGAGK